MPPRRDAVVAIRAGAVLPLTGRYAALAADSAHGLRAWADLRDIDLTIADCGDDPADAAQQAVALAGTVDVFMGPYGSGAMRAVADALSGRRVVVWNHGGSAVPHRRAWIVDVLGAADTYWAGLADVLADRGLALDRVAIVHSAGGFGQAVAAGAIESLARHRVAPLRVGVFDRESARESAAALLAAGAETVIGCGRYEDDIALGHALVGSEVAVGLVACGVRSAAGEFGAGLVGWFGPSQWAPGPDLPAGLDADVDYPAAQAYAAGLIAEQAIAEAGSVDPRAVWDAVRSLRTRTFFGPFAIDRGGRQVAHRPLLVEWVAGPAGPVRHVVWRSDGDV